MENVRHIGMIGTGMIATSMAVLTTGHGYRTTLLAVNNELAADSKKIYDTFYQELLAKKLMTPKQVAACEKHLHYTLSYQDLADADVVFEAVFEVLDIKHSVYRELETNCPNLKAICSVSSAIVPDDLAKGMGKYRDRIIVTHPFNPPHLVPYFELVQGKDTAEGVADFAIELLKDLDRKPVLLKKGAPGFIGNRLQFALWREALYIVESGIADPEDVDTCLMYSFCPRYTSIGMFEHFDNGGLDLNYNVCKKLFPDLCDAKEVMSSITDKIAAGNLGQKTGVGFYDWRDADMSAYRERVSAPYWRFFNWRLPEA